MRLVRRFSTHESPKIQSPKDAGVVFTSRVIPIRFTLNFKSWLFLCAVGFSGAICGNIFHSKLLLRQNPPNPKQDPSDLPPERHPHTPEDD